MKNTIIIICFFALTIKPAFMQDSNNALNFGLHSGFFKQTTTDHLLNYYNYTDKLGIPIRVTVNYPSKKIITVITSQFCKSTLTPSNYNSNLYEFNNINNINWDFYFEILYQIINKPKIYFGIINSIFYNYQTVKFKSLLYNRQEFKKSYDFSAYNLSPQIKCILPLNKHIIGLSSSVSIFNISARPDDNYIKQTGYKSYILWNTSSFKNFTGYHFELSYLYQLTPLLSLSASLGTRYREYKNTDKYQYLNQYMLLGIYKKIKFNPK